MANPTSWTNTPRPTDNWTDVPKPLGVAVGEFDVSLLDEAEFDQQPVNQSWTNVPRT